MSEEVNSTSFMMKAHSLIQRGVCVCGLPCALLVFFLALTLAAFRWLIHSQCSASFSLSVFSQVFFTVIAVTFSNVSMVAVFCKLFYIRNALQAFYSSSVLQCSLHPSSLMPEHLLHCGCEGPCQGSPLFVLLEGWPVMGDDLVLLGGQGHWAPIML